MRQYEVREHKDYRRREARRACDLCGIEIPASLHGRGMGYYDISEIEIVARIGTQYPAGSTDGSEYLIDLCPACFLGRLVPWLEGQGAKVEPWKLGTISPAIASAGPASA